MRTLVSEKILTRLKSPTASTKVLLVILVLLLSTAVVAPFFLTPLTTTPDGRVVWQLITTHDLANLLPMIEQFDKVLRSGVAYPRWNPDFNLGYGTATANFYPPGTLYITSLINAALNNWVITLFILSILSLAASFLAFYALARTFYSRLASLVAALFYTVLPYHQLDLYWRGAIPEFVGFAFIPVILYFAFKLGSEGRLKYYAAVGLCHGVYLMTHLPVGYLYTYALAFYAVLWAFRDRDIKIALRIAGGMAISLAVSAIYWLPAALEGKYIYEWASGFFPYHETYITLLPPHDSFDKHLQEAFEYNALTLIVTVAILLALPNYSISNSAAPSVGQDKRPAFSQSQTKLWIILGIMTPFMSTSFSIYLSKLIPKIQIAVPPFRWLAISCMFTSLLIAASIDLLRTVRSRSPKRLFAYKVALAAVIVVNVWLTVSGIILDALSKPAQTPALDFIDSAFTPKDATRPGELPNTPSVVITPEGGAIEVLHWLPTHREIAVRVDQPSEVRLKTYNFPGWTARIDGKVVPMLSDQDGVQQIAVPPGIHNLQASFENTAPRTAGAVLSAVGLLIVFGLSLGDRLRQRGVVVRKLDRPALDSLPDEEKTPAPSVPGSATTVHSQLKRYSVVILVVLAGAAILIVAVKRPDSQNTNRTDGSSSGNIASRATGVSGKSQLYLAERDWIAVAVDESVTGELLVAISGKNDAALQTLIESGKALKVSNNTRVQILQTMAGQAKVRILEGPNVMKDVWVPERWLR